MRLTTEQMEAILEANLELLERDSEAVALEFEVAPDGEVLALVLVHTRSDEAEGLYFAGSAKATPGLAPLPVKVVRGPAREEETAPIDEQPFHAEAALDTNAGLAGTRVCESGGCGTLCLSGGSISIQHATQTCSTERRFLLSNSHVFHRVGGSVTSSGSAVGTVACVFDLEAKTTFDAGIADAADSVPADHAFKVFSPNKRPLEIAGLRNAETGMIVGKMGMRTGWTEGRVGAPTRTRVSGHRALYPAWNGTYRSRSGDSGSPILHKATDGKWYLVGIHFSSGPCFHSWNNAEVSVSRS